MASRCVPACTALLALAAAGFALRFGSEVPVVDEWSLVVGALDAADRPAWLIEHHNEHRYPAGKLLWAAALRAGSFKFAMLVNVLALTAASLMFTAAARNFRGRASFADLIVPCLLLHWGHWYTFLMSYQVVFSLWAMGLAGVARAASRVRPGGVVGPAVGGGLAAWVAGLSGGWGLAVTPALLVWMLNLVRLRWADGRPGRRRDVAVMAVFPVGLSAYAVWAGLTTPVGGAGDPSRLLAGLGDFARTGLGSASVSLAGVAAYAAALVPLRCGRRRALLAPLLAAVACAAGAVAYGRGPGLADRFVTPSAAGLAVCYVAWAAAGLGRVSPAVLLAGVVVYATNLAPGYDQGVRTRNAVKEFLGRLQAGSPPVMLGGEFGSGWPFVAGEQVGDVTAELCRRGVGVFAGAAADPPLHRIALTSPNLPARLACDDAPFRPGGPPPPSVDLPSPGRVVFALRVRLAQRHHMGFQKLRLCWVDRRTGAAESATAYAPPSPGDAAATFRVAGEPTGVRLELMCPARGLDVTAAEWLVGTCPSNSGPRPRPWPTSCAR